MTEIKTWSPSVKISSAKRATQLRLVVVPLVKSTSFVEPALMNLPMVSRAASYDAVALTAKV